MSIFMNKPVDANQILENSLEIYRQTFIATEGQKVFTLNSTYQTNKNRINVVVGGIPQYSPTNFTETSSNTIELSEGVPSGTPVIVELLQ